MPSRFEKYRVRDGKTTLGESFFNPVFGDIDLRIAALEELRIAWEEATRLVTEFGLLRINEILGPTLGNLQDASASAEALRQGALTALDELQQAIANVPALAIDIPAIDGRVGALETGKADQAQFSAAITRLPVFVQPTELADVAPAAGLGPEQLAIVEGFGLYRFDAQSALEADGEIVVAPAAGNGRWLLCAPHWDFVWAYFSGVTDELQRQVDTSRFLFYGESLNFPSIAAGASATLTLCTPRAEVSDGVLLVPPSALPNGLVPMAYIAAQDYVTVRLNNVTAAAIDPAAMTFSTVIVKR